MFSLTFYVTLLSCSLVYGSESSEEVDALPTNPSAVPCLKSLLKSSYDENKLGILSELVNSLQEEIENITLVGSQNIYEANGEISETHTLELHMPKKSEKDSSAKTASSEEDDGDSMSVPEVKALFELISLMGFKLSVAGQTFNEEGEVIEQAYLDDSLVYSYSDGIQLVNKTIKVDSDEDVNQQIAELMKNHSVLSIHRFNDQHQLVKEGSHIIPEYVAEITSAEGETTQELFDEILKGLTTSLLTYNSDEDVIPGKLAEYLKSKYADKDFFVSLDEPGAWYLGSQHIFKVVAQYDLAAWENDETITYTVFGFKT